MDVCVIGTGYVGLVTGACMAEVGHRVICVDDDHGKIRTLQSGGIPIYEPGLDAMVERQRRGGRLTFTTEISEGIAGATIAFICVGTPPKEDGDADLVAVEKVTRRIAECAASYTLIVQKSTVPVHTGTWIERTLEVYGRTAAGTFDVASNPEFLREGSAVEDFLHPERLVFGVQNSRSEQLLRELYAPIIERVFTCPVHERCPEREPVPVVITDVPSAELIKHASNSFLALKISFINAVADLCERVGADVEQVAHGMGLDRRIGPAFLRAGLGFGGYCFPKDLQAFIAMARRHGMDFALLREVERINQARIDRAVAKLQDRLWNLRDKVVGVLGLAFKPHTDDVRFAPALALIERLEREGVTVRAYDPHANEKAREALPGFTCCPDPYAVAEGAEALVLCTEWPEFAELDWARLRGAMVRPLLIDGRNALDPQKLAAAGFEYVGMGR